MADKQTVAKVKKFEVTVLRGYRFKENSPMRKKGANIKITQSEYEFAKSNSYVEGGV